MLVWETIPMIEEGTLMGETLRLLQSRNRSVTLSGIANTTGINFFWLRKFIGKEIKNPSVNIIQKLYEHLSGRKLI